MIKIDAHVHLWECQNGIVGGRPVVSVGNGKSDFGGEIRQMMPPYMEDGRNTAERLIANMDYAGVNLLEKSSSTIFTKEISSTIFTKKISSMTGSKSAQVVLQIRI